MAIVSTTTTFTSDTETVTRTKLNGLVADLLTEFNGSIDKDNVAISIALSYTTTFTNGDLSTGVLTVNHAMGRQYINISVYDNNDIQVTPDEITATDTNNTAVDLSSFGTLSGTWNVRASI